MNGIGFVEGEIDREMGLSPGGMEKSADFWNDLAVGGNRVAKIFANAGTEVGRLGHAVVAAANNNLNPFGGHMNYHADWADDFQRDVDNYYDTGKYGRQAVELERRYPVYKAMNDVTSGVIASIPEAAAGGWVAGRLAPAATKVTSAGRAAASAVAGTRAGSKVVSAANAASKAAPRLARVAKGASRMAAAPIVDGAKWLKRLARPAAVLYPKTEEYPLFESPAVRLGLKDPSGQAERLARMYENLGLREWLPWYPYEDAARDYDKNGGWAVYDANGNQAFRVRSDGKTVPVVADSPYLAAATGRATRDANEWFQSKTFGAYNTSVPGRLFANEYARMNPRPEYELDENGRVTGNVVPRPFVRKDDETILTDNLYGIGNGPWGRFAKGALQGAQWAVPVVRSAAVPGIVASDVANGNFGDAYAMALGGELMGALPAAESVPLVRSTGTTRYLYDLLSPVGAFHASGKAADALPDFVNGGNGVADRTVDRLFRGNATAMATHDIAAVTEDFSNDIKNIAPEVYDRYRDYLDPSADPGSKLAGLRAAIPEIRNACAADRLSAAVAKDWETVSAIDGFLKYIDGLDRILGAEHLDPAGLQEDYMNYRGGFDPRWFEGFDGR